jgi:hypothetical protein
MKILTVGLKERSKERGRDRDKDPVGNIAVAEPLPWPFLSKHGYCPSPLGPPFTPTTCGSSSSLSFSFLLSAFSFALTTITNKLF